MPQPLSTIQGQHQLQNSVRPLAVKNSSFCRLYALHNVRASVIQTKNLAQTRKSTKFIAIQHFSILICWNMKQVWQRVNQRRQSITIVNLLNLVINGHFCDHTPLPNTLPSHPVLDSVFSLPNWILSKTSLHSSFRHRASPLPSSQKCCNDI